MKRMLSLVLLLLLVALVGYFAVMNSHNVAIRLYGSFTLQFTVWVVIIASIIVGFAFSEIRQVFTNPGRLVQRARRAWSERRKHRMQEQVNRFLQACQRGDTALLEKLFKPLKTHEDTTVSLKIQHLEQLRYQLDAEQLLKEYDNLLKEAPEDLQLRLAFLKQALEVKSWDRIADLTRSLSETAPFHPEVIDAMRQLERHCGNWSGCVEQEKKLLERFSGKVAAEGLVDQHAKHLREAFRHHPKQMKDWNFSYLGELRQQSRFKILSGLGKMELLKLGGNFGDAASLLRKCYEETGAPELLDEWEALYKVATEKQSVLKQMMLLHNSRKRSAAGSLLLAKLLYAQNDFEHSEKVLRQINWPAGEQPELHLALKYLLAKKLKHDQEVPKILAHWLSEDKILQQSLLPAPLPVSAHRQLQRQKNVAEV